MSLAHHLRGYHKRTAYLGVDFVISPELLPAVREVLPEAADDPDLIDPHELSRDQTVWLVELTALAIDPDRFDYFLEAEEDWRVVAAIRDSLFARA